MFLLLCVVAIRSEDTRPWMHYQKDFVQLYAARHCQAQGSDGEERYQRDSALAARDRRGLASAKPEIAQIYLEDLKVADRCTTCHRGIDNPLFEDAPQPFAPIRARC